jgi:hypothetical protein
MTFLNPQTFEILIYEFQLRKKSNFGVTPHPSSRRGTLSVLHPAGFEGLEFGAFA